MTPTRTFLPFIDLQAQYASLKAEVDQAVQTVLERGQFILGPEVKALERELAGYCGTADAVGVASGTDAIELALRACGVGAGDEVLTTVYSFFATAEAIVAVGAIPVFVDIDPETYALDPEAMEAKVTPRTKAIVPVHLYGHPCDMGRIMAVAHRHALRVVEDCAQAIGARYHGRPVGSFGDAGACSFYPTKNLGAYGDGGMVVTNHAALAERVRLLRAHGSEVRYHHRMVGKNSRLDELQAAILRVKLRSLDQWNAARRAVATRYRAMLAARCRPGEVISPSEQPGCVPVYHLYTIRVRDRDRIADALGRAGVSTQVCYPGTLAAQPALQPWLRPAETYPNAEAAAQAVLSLPCYPELPPEGIEYAVEQLAQALASR